MFLTQHYLGLRLKLPLRYCSWNMIMESVILLIVLTGLVCDSARWTDFWTQPLKLSFAVVVRFWSVKYSVIDSAKKNIVLKALPLDPAPPPPNLPKIKFRDAANRKRPRSKHAWILSEQIFFSVCYNLFFQKWNRSISGLVNFNMWHKNTCMELNLVIRTNCWSKHVWAYFLFPVEDLFVKPKYQVNTFNTLLWGSVYCFPTRTSGWKK